MLGIGRGSACRIVLRRNASPPERVVCHRAAAARRCSPTWSCLLTFSCVHLFNLPVSYHHFLSQILLVCLPHSIRNLQDCFLVCFPVFIFSSTYYSSSNFVAHLSLCLQPVVVFCIFHLCCTFLLIPTLSSRFSLYTPFFSFLSLFIPCPSVWNIMITHWYLTIRLINYFLFSLLFSFTYLVSLASHFYHLFCFVPD